MYSLMGRIGYSVAKMRLVSSIITTVFFSILLYVASVNLKWFTLIGGFYLLLGIVEGVLIGQLEARIVTQELDREKQMTPWKTLFINAVSLGLPLILTAEVFGASEFLRFAVYLVLPFIPASQATTWWQYNKFERKNRVQIMTYIYGLKFWTEPIPDATEEFSQFMDAVTSKDYFSIISQARQSRKLIATLERRTDMKPSKQKALLNILTTMDEYRHRLLTLGSLFMASLLILMVYFFVMAGTNVFGLEQVKDNRIVSGQAITLILLCVPTFSVFGGVFAAIFHLRNRFQKRITELLSHVNSD